MLVMWSVFTDFTDLGLFYRLQNVGSKWSVFPWKSLLFASQVCFFFNYSPYIISLTGWGQKSVPSVTDYFLFILWWSFSVGNVVCFYRPWSVLQTFSKMLAQNGLFLLKKVCFLPLRSVFHAFFTHKILFSYINIHKYSTASAKFDMDVKK